MRPFHLLRLACRSNIQQHNLRMSTASRGIVRSHGPCVVWSKSCRARRLTKRKRSNGYRVIRRFFVFFLKWNLQPCLQNVFHNQIYKYSQNAFWPGFRHGADTRGTKLNISTANKMAEEEMCWQKARQMSQGLMVVEGLGVGGGGVNGNQSLSLFKTPNHNILF